MNLHRVRAAFGKMEQRPERRHEQATEERLVERVHEIAPDARLQDIATTATPERLADNRVRVVHAQKHDRCGRKSVLPECAKRLKAVEPRHIDIKDDDVRVDLARLIEGLGAIECDTRHIKVVRQH